MTDGIVTLPIFEATLGGLNTRIDRIDERLDEHNSRFDRIDERLDEHDQQFDLMHRRADERAARLAGELAASEKRLSWEIGHAINAAVETMTTQLGVLIDK